MSAFLMGVGVGAALMALGVARALRREMRR